MARAGMVACGGSIRVNGVLTQERDGVAVSGETELLIEALDDSEKALVIAPPQAPGKTA